MQSSDISNTTREVVRQSRSFVADQLDTQSTRLGKQLASTAGDLRRIATDLRSSDTLPVSSADLATRGADTIDRIGTYLQSSDGEALIVDLEEFARERPWAVAAAALAAGFAASRVLKASSTRRYRTNARYAE